MTVVLPAKQPGMTDEDIVTMRAIARMPKRRRQVLLMMAQGYTQKAISAKLGIRVNSVKTHLTKAYGAMYPTNVNNYSLSIRTAYLVGRYMREVTD